MKTVLVCLNSKFSHSSLAIRYLEKYCENFRPETAEYTINDDVYDIWSSLVRKKGDIYCFSCYIWNIEKTAVVASMIKTALPGCKIVFGGPEASGKWDFVDHTVTGEGEEALYYLLSCLEQGKCPPEVIQKETDISKIPFPYTEDEIKKLKNKIIYFETSRGCPYSCAYCLSSIDKNLRFFPMDYVKKGLSFFFGNNVPVVKLVDRTFNCHNARAAEIIKFITENSKNTCVHMEMAPNLINDEIISLLSRAPHLFKLEMGIQSTNPKTLKAINREFDLKKSAENIRRLAQTGIKIHLDLIAGLPYEDYESIGQSFDFVCSLQPDMLQLGFLKVLNGTPIQSQAGIYSSPYPPYEVLKTDWLSPQQLCRLKSIAKAVDRFYNSGVFKKSIKALTKDSPFPVFEKLAELLQSAEKSQDTGLTHKLFMFRRGKLTYINFFIGDTTSYYLRRLQTQNCFAQ